MYKKKLKKIVSLLLLVCIIVTSMNIDIYAQDNGGKEKTNFNFIKVLEDGRTEYTYEENGVEYLVKESANNELTQVDTSIYIKDTDGEYNLFDKFTTIIQTNNEFVEIMTIDSNGSRSVERIETDTIVRTDILQTRATNGWKFMYTYKGSVKLEKYTLTAVIAALVACVSAAGGITAGLSVVLGAVAQEAINNKYPTAYVKQDLYYYFVNSIPTRYRTITQYYSNSALTQKFGDKITREADIPLGGN